MHYFYYYNLSLIARIITYYNSRPRYSRRIADSCRRPKTSCKEFILTVRSACLLWTVRSMDSSMSLQR